MANPSKLYFGREQNVSYSPASGCLSPSDNSFLAITLTLILVPSLLCLVVVIFLNYRFEIWLKVLLTIIYAISLYMCLSQLFKCSFTDPGILPALAEEQDAGRPDSKKHYHVKYMDESELHQSLTQLGVGERDYA